MLRLVEDAQNVYKCATVSRVMAATFLPLMQPSDAHSESISTRNDATTHHTDTQPGSRKGDGAAVAISLLCEICCNLHVSTFRPWEGRLRAESRAQAIQLLALQVRRIPAAVGVAGASPAALALGVSSISPTRTASPCAQVHFLAISISLRMASKYADVVKAAKGALVVDAS